MGAADLGIIEGFYGAVELGTAPAVGVTAGAPTVNGFFIFMRQGRLHFLRRRWAVSPPATGWPRQWAAFASFCKALGCVCCGLSPFNCLQLMKPAAVHWRAAMAFFDTAGDG